MIGTKNGTSSSEAIKSRELLLSSKLSDKNHACASDTMNRIKDKDVENQAKVFKEMLMLPGLAGHSQEFFEELHSGLAELMEGVKGRDPYLQQLVANFAAHTLQAELKVRKNETSPTIIKEPARDGHVPPEDRILHALASLLDEAKGQEAAHQVAMAKAAAEITTAIKDIKALRQKEWAATGQLPSPITGANRPGSVLKR